MDPSTIRDPTDPEESRLRQAVIDARTKCVFTGGKAREAQANLKQLGDNLRYQPLTDAEKNARRSELKREAEAAALADAEAIGAFNEAQRCLDEYLAEKAARTSSESVIPLPAPAERGLVPVVAAASASEPPKLLSGETPIPVPTPQASKSSRKQGVPIMWWKRIASGAIIAAVLFAGLWLFLPLGGKVDPDATPGPQTGLHSQPPSAPVGALPPRTSPEPTMAPPVTGTFCAADKQGTFAELTDGERHRIETGFGGWGHDDLYPDPGVPAISYVTPPTDNVDIFWGYGSEWLYVGSGCTQQTSLEDAYGYAVGNNDWQPGRLNNNHSGIVIDLQDCVLYNSQNWDESDVQALLDLHADGWEEFRCGDLEDNDSGATYTVNALGHETSSVTLSDGATPEFSEDDGEAGPSCAQGKRRDFESNFTGQQQWHIKTGNRWAAVNFWSNWEDPNYGSVSFLLKPGMDVSLKGGGDVTFIKGDCTPEQAEAIRANSQNKHIDYADLPSRFK